MTDGRFYERSKDLKSQVEDSYLIGDVITNSTLKQLDNRNQQLSTIDYHYGSMHTINFHSFPNRSYG